MTDKIIQITTAWCWRGSWEDSSEVVHGLGESGVMYEYVGKEWIKLAESPEKEAK